MILCDTGVLLCVIDQSQSLHKVYIEAFTRLPMPFLTTWACMTEAMYFADRCGGYRLQRKLGGMLQNNVLQIYDIQTEDYERLFGLIETYQDRPMDFADATLVLAAERTGKRQILTIDSDFLFYRIGDGESFEIIPVD
ncbi:nucleic acid-binding protein [Acaryochloris sp. 'Moss Beach']|uniref:type II toxin-antitoxin system VapC family toxin n=1 Tax=Acaryochloris sp. 'Moss Beach' TaxID=2740837 RepID=UPI001F19ED88|nr:hypothetical protein [Acaryochloris sp. 'Moss Beach']UJB71092.1 nucleic acid-binding protein [Acaryochloris sp. 'Moss Beach']